MDWVTVISSVIVLWIASLCKIMLTACSSSKTSFLNGGVIRKNVLPIQMTSPCNEVFTPTINYFSSRGYKLHIVCMSTEGRGRLGFRHLVYFSNSDQHTGDADGMGNSRKEELYRASVVVKVPQQQVKTLDSPEFQDGVGKVWNLDLLAIGHYYYRRSSYSLHRYDTFDNFGVSGHSNHRDVNHGIRYSLSKTLLSSMLFTESGSFRVIVDGSF